jgi:hypothetical protein
MVLVSDEYKPDSVGWRMEQEEIQGRVKVRSSVSAGGASWLASNGLEAIAVEQALGGEMPSP